MEESGSGSVIIDWELSVDNVVSSFFYNGQNTFEELDGLIFSQLLILRE